MIVHGTNKPARLLLTRIARVQTNAYKIYKKKKRGVSCLSGHEAYMLCVNLPAQKAECGALKAVERGVNAFCFATWSLKKAEIGP